LTENARKVLEARYLKKNERGECIETPADLFRRVARTIADVELRYGASEAERQQWEDRFYGLMTSGAFMPNSPTLMNAGREMGMLSACFVLPVRDSINDIFNSIKHTALIQKAGGGTGFAFDELRPTGDYIASSGGTTSGPISFWRAFSEATNAIQQGAFRRGANMGMMYIHHPDILKFLHAKQDLNQFTNYNISVKVTDAWMREFIEDPDSPHVVRNPRTGESFVLPRALDIWKHDVRDLAPAEFVEPLPRGDRRAYFTTPQINAEVPAELRGKVYTKRQVWDIIVRNAWQTGEPGVVFIDRINESNPTPHVGRIEATNPCGEQPLLPYEACNLGSVNLGAFVRDACTPQARVDWNGLREAVHLSTRYLDNVIDANNYPLAEIDRICKANRKIGLGVMGFADALYMLGVPYNSDEGVAWGESFMKFVDDESHNYSEHLARTRGCFPNWSGSVWQTRHNRLMRNSCCTTVAPTGTISIIANCSGGIEPMFSLAFIRNVLKGQRQGERPLFEVNETFRRLAESRGILSDVLLERIATEGTLAHIEAVPADIKQVFVCAHDITPEWHMKMQAAFQRHCDASISKTINFPRDATVADVEKIYMLAFELRCKGVTVYRDGCRECQPMALKDKNHEAAKERSPEREHRQSSGNGAAAAGTVADREAVGSASDRAVAAPSSDYETRLTGAPSRTQELVAAPPASPVVPSATASVAAPASTLAVASPRTRIEPQDLPEIVSGLRIRQMTPFGNMHVKITVDPKANRELEVFAQLGKGGDVATSDLEAICRMISLWLRAGGSLRLVIKQLEGIGSSLQIPTRAGRIMSLGDGLASALKKYLKAKERFGLTALLLGEVDLAQLDSPPPPHADDDSHDRIAASGDNGSAGGNGDLDHGPDNGNGNGPALRAGWAVATERGAAASAPRADVARGVRAERPRSAAVEEKRSLRIGADAAHDGGDSASATAVLENPVAERGALLDLTPVADALLIREAPAAGKNGNGNGAHGALLGFHDVAEHYKVKCPECNSPLALQEGCRKCHACGWAAC
jgi:ribonucleoside-diphosphate reductase alpha chain